MTLARTLSNSSSNKTPAITTKAWSRTITTVNSSARRRSHLSSYRWLAVQPSTSIMISRSNSSTGSSRCYPNKVAMAQTLCKKFVHRPICSCLVSCWANLIQQIRTTLWARASSLSSPSYNNRWPQALWHSYRRTRTTLSSNTSSCMVSVAMGPQRHLQALRISWTSSSSSS